MKTAEFESLYNKLNPKQREAVDTIEGPVMVVAGPGTGKTQILTLRIANILLKTDASPDSILALTFTESGAHAMRKRLVGIIGSPAYKVHIHTFHGFCNEIIRKYPEEFPRIISSVNISEIDQIRIIEEIVDASHFDYLKPYGDAYYFVRPILSGIRDLKREGVTPADFKAHLEVQHKELMETPDLYHEKGAHKGKMKGEYKDIEKKLEKNKELAVVYEKYEKLLAKSKKFDYEDMILEVVRTLKANADFLLMLQEQYQYILADEHQDTNNAQNSILELLSSFHESPNLFIVGDEKQAIFRFQGATLDNFLYFSKLHKDVKLINLEDNYRSTQSILDSAHSVIMNTAGADAKLRVPLRTNTRDAAKKIELYAFSKPDFENFFVIDDIRKTIESGVPAHEIAVLYRDNRDVEPLLHQFEKTDIPFVIESDQDVLKSGILSKLILLIRAVEGFGNDEVLSRALHIDVLGFETLDVYKMIAYATKERRPLYDVIKSFELLTHARLEKPQAMVDFYNKLVRWNREGKNSHFLEFLDVLINESGVLEYILKNPGSLENLSRLDAFFNEVRNLSESHKEYTIDHFISYINVLDHYGLMIKKSGQSMQRGVRLMTTHKSKGLEFDYVYLVGCFDGHWGNRTSRNAFSLSFKDVKSLSMKGNNDDERRLFFVALTRARKHVVLSYSKEGTTGKSQLPSQFISEIRPDMLSDVPTTELEAAFISTIERKYAPKLHQEANLKDKAYLTHLFDEQGLSVTALNNYLACPWQYFYSNLVRIPSPQNKAAMFGTAVHGALRSFFTLYKDERPVSAKILCDFFEGELARMPLSEVEFVESLEKGKAALKGYFDTYKGTWNKNILLEFDIRGVELGSGPQKVLIKGKLDKLEFINERDVNVVDYKTGKPKSRNQIEGKTAEADGNYKRQLVFYKLLLEKAYPEKYRMLSGEIDFIEPNDSGAYKRERFEVTEGEVEELEKLVLGVSEEIRNLAFWDRYCEDKECRYCGLRKVMN